MLKLKSGSIVFSMKLLSVAVLLFAVELVISSGFGAAATSVSLQSPTATFSQSNVGDFGIRKTIDGLLNDNYGWAIQGAIGNQTAAFETSQNIGYTQGSLLTFSLIQNANWFEIVHTVGRFRLSVTTDDRSTFADGLRTGGDVSANWIVLQPLSYDSAQGATLTRLADDSILASGPSLFNETYTVTALTTLTGITGVRLEMLTDPSLPAGGPGRTPEGNFVLSEFTVSITQVPEPTALSLIGLGTAAMLVSRRRRA